MCELREHGHAPSLKSLDDLIKPGVYDKTTADSRARRGGRA
jgi:hypothetical protein